MCRLIKSLSRIGGVPVKAMDKETVNASIGNVAHEERRRTALICEKLLPSPTRLV
jgi:hypothetical protein